MVRKEILALKEMAEKAKTVDEIARFWDKFAHTVTIEELIGWLEFKGITFEDYLLRLDEKGLTGVAARLIEASPDMTLVDAICVKNEEELKKWLKHREYAKGQMDHGKGVFTKMASGKASTAERAVK